MNRRIFNVAVIGATAVGLAACDTDGLTEINVNPNNPTDAPAPALFTQGARLTTSRWLGNASARGFSLVAQHLAEGQYPESDQYVRLEGNFTAGLFDGAYTSELMDLTQVIRRGRAAEEPGYYGPAMVLRSLGFSYLTDIWGDIPYFSALAADSVAEAIQPTYDPQQEIYADLFQQLAAATTAMANAPGTGLRFGSADPIYEGDLAAWQRFSNSLRARLALRIVNVDAAKASAELQAAFSAPGGVFTANTHNAIFAWPGNGVYDNPWAVNFETRDDHRMSDRMMTYLLGWNDPRTPIYAMPTAADANVYAGLPNALTHTQASVLLDQTSRPGAIFYPGTTNYGNFGGQGRAYPSYLMTYAEVAFIQAEAAQRGLGGLSAAQAAGFYEAGVRASMAQWGVTNQGVINAYLAQPDVAYKGGAEGLRQIGVQKWLALYTDGAQAWAEWRRTCVPSNIRPGPEAIIAQVPRRYQYSTTETTTNNTNVQDAVSRQGADNFLSRMWWDRQPEAAPTHVANCGQR